MRPRALLPAALAAAGLALAGCGGSSPHSSSTSTPAGGSTAPASTSASGGASSFAGQTGFEGVTIEGGAPIAPASTTGTDDIDGISCGATEQLAYHIHVHLAIYVNGQPRALPGGIGIPGSQEQNDPQEGPVAAGGQCIYWLHTHAPDGVIHVESPTQRLYTLGNFFDEWHQPLTANRIGSASGPITVFLNGKLWKHPVRDVPLTPHAVIQISVGEPVAPFHAMSWAGLSL
jgi:hypothetical protein